MHIYPRDHGNCDKCDQFFSPSVVLVWFEFECSRWWFVFGGCLEQSSRVCTTNLSLLGWYCDIERYIRGYWIKDRKIDSMTAFQINPVFLYLAEPGRNYLNQYLFVCWRSLRYIDNLVNMALNTRDHRSAFRILFTETNSRRR